MPAVGSDCRTGVMNEDPLGATGSDISGQQTLAGAMRFVRALRLRRKLVVWSLIVAFLLGGMYYATAPRYFESMAGLLVLQNSTGVLQDQSTQDRMVQSQMPTYQKI